jgi:beta-lactamase class A
MWQRKQRSRVKDQVILAIILAIALLVLGYFLVRFVQGRDSSLETSQNMQPAEPLNQEQTQSSPPEFNSQALQEVIDTWQANHSGTASVVTMDANGSILAEAGDIDQVYFAASIYKLYVAYFGYKQVDAGEVDPEEVYVGGRTRAECLDAMIRSSDSPCAEALWNELGKDNLTQELKKIDIVNTNMTSISTTARDAARMLTFIGGGEGLSTQSQQNYLSSMKDQEQLYRRGLPAGFSNDVIVQNKVGWNEQVEWHDTSIIEYPDGRRLIIVVLTESVGSKKIAELGTAIEQATR